MAQPDLSGRVVLVTGGTSGIGLATAAAFLNAGAAVAVAGRDAGRGQTALRQLEPHAREAGMVMFQPTDVTEEGEVEELVRAVQRRFGGLDIAVNGAANAEGPLGKGRPAAQPSRRPSALLRRDRSRRTSAPTYGC
ncbi:SDR family NAD(P)-dependent oxidoreductase [Blastococcus sp. SYSU DS0539]